MALLVTSLASCSTPSGGGAARLFSFHAPLLQAQSLLFFYFMCACAARAWRTRGMRSAPLPRPSCSSSSRKLLSLGRLSFRAVVIACYRLLLFFFLAPLNALLLALRCSSSSQALFSPGRPSHWGFSPPGCFLLALLQLCNCAMTQLHSMGAWRASLSPVVWAELPTSLCDGRDSFYVL